MRDSLRIPLHINIVTLFLGISFILAALLAWYNYKENKKAALDSAKQILFEVNEKVSERILSTYDTVYSLAGTLSELPDLDQKPGMLMHPIAWNTFRALKEHPGIHSVYLGFNDKDYYQIVSFYDDTETKRIVYGAPGSAWFAVRRIFRREDGVRMEVMRYLDADKRTVDSAYNREPAYDPTVRPWYRLGAAVNERVKTELYIYSFLNAPGFTVARRFNGPVPGVLAVDITLDHLCRFLAIQQIGESGQVMIFNAKGQIVAHPDRKKVIVNQARGPGSSAVVPATVTDLGNPVMDAIFQQFSANGEQTGIIDSGGGEYLWRVTPMSGAMSQGEYIAVMAPVDDFTGAIARTRTKSLVFTAVAFLLAVPVIILVSRKISEPLRLLVAEADAIRRFELDAPLELKSKITEVHNLATSMAAMKTAVQTFGRYVPRTLVERIVSRQMLPILGGERREVTILFTDVADFTTLSETVSAEDLMVNVSRYFNELGTVITRNQGTIDKYIGDAIMAFWNAPEEDEDHVLHACQAALEAKLASDRLNEAWMREGKPVMVTRLGLHASDVVVGNVGSHDRMNYTAIGRAVNTASRLEGLNKHYGTSILVGEAVHHRANGLFVMRPIDLVQPKGSKSPLEVFELMGAHPENAAAPQETRATAGDAAFCAAWKAAHALYRERRFAEAHERFAALAAERPGDRPSRIYEARTAMYAQNPPEKDWNGVEEFTVK